MTEILVSEHAYKRIKERFGLGKQATRRYAEKAFYNGVAPRDYHNKDAAAWYDARQRADRSHMYNIYNDRVFIFGLRGDVPILLTAYSLYDDAPERLHTYGRGQRIYRNRDPRKFRTCQ